MSVLMKRFSARVSSVAAQASGTLVGGPAVLRGLHYNDTSGGQAGSVILRDGGSGGAILLKVNTPGGGVGEDILIPAGGIKFETNIYLELSGVDAATIFYNR